MYKVSTDDITLTDNNSFTFNLATSDSVVATDTSPGGGTPDYTDALGALGYFLESYTEDSAITETTAISFS
jgi:hypothetical protein